MVLAICGFNLSAYAYTDEIESYEITIDLNENAQAEITYYIRWKVLESDSLGPVSWIQVGVANGYCDDVESLNATSQYAYYDGGNMVRVDLDREYYEGETFEVSFRVTQDYIYTTTEDSDTATYSFTPGWFDDIPVDKLILRWNADNALTWSPDCYIDSDNYLVFEKKLSAGERYKVTVTYPIDAYNFEYHVDEINSSSNYTYSGDTYYSHNSYDDDSVDAIAGLFILIFIFCIIRGLIKNATASSYKSGSGFAPSKVITRKMITYYPTCPGCGAVRNEEMTKCEYCGRSFIEKEEIVTEKEILNDKRYANDGSYRYNNNPNVYIHVSSRPAPRPTHTTTHHSSCAHSSCACACASCACACACACAGGGRAGCSTKDFYNTGLKLKQLEKRTKAQK